MTIDMRCARFGHLPDSVRSRRIPIRHPPAAKQRCRAEVFQAVLLQAVSQVALLQVVSQVALLQAVSQAVSTGGVLAGGALLLKVDRVQRSAYAASSPTLTKSDARCISYNCS